MRNRQNNVEISEGAPARRRRTRRVLAAFLAGSAALHAAALVVLPGISFDREPAQVRVLEVVLVQIEPPRSLPVEPVPALPQPPRSRAAERTVATAQSYAPPPQEDAPTILALPEPRPTADSVFTAPTVKPAETQPPAPEQKTRVANVAVTPPSFSATYLRNPAPRYPQAARRAGEQGTVTLRVLVTREGLPARVDLEKSSGSTHLDNAALETVKTWRFTPARQGAEPVESWVLVPIVFRLEG